MKKPTCPESAAQVVTRSDFELLDSYLRYWYHSCPTDREAREELRQFRRIFSAASSPGTLWCQAMEHAANCRRLAQTQSRHILELGPQLHLTLARHEHLRQARLWVQHAEMIRLSK